MCCTTRCWVVFGGDWWYVLRELAWRKKNLGWAGAADCREALGKFSQYSTLAGGTFTSVFCLLHDDVVEAMHMPRCGVQLMIGVPTSHLTVCKVRRGPRLECAFCARPPSVSRSLCPFFLPRHLGVNSLPLCTVCLRYHSIFGAWSLMFLFVANCAAAGLRQRKRGHRHGLLGEGDRAQPHGLIRLGPTLQGLRAGAF